MTASDLSLSVIEKFHQTLAVLRVSHFPSNNTYAFLPVAQMDAACIMRALEWHNSLSYVRFMKLTPTILGGGAGSRLWSVFRELHPKPFIRLADGQSLLENAWLCSTAKCGRDIDCHQLEKSSDN